METYPYNPFLSGALDNLDFHGNLGIIIKNLSQLCFLTIMILIEKINQGVKSFFAHLELLSGKLLFLLNMYTNFVGLSHIFRYFAVYMEQRHTNCNVHVNVTSKDSDHPRNHAF